MNPLKLKDQWGYSETSKNGWIILLASIAYETKAAQKISSRNSTLGKTKLIFWSTGKKANKNRVS